jgi:glycosyltransferase involved in cell wall biosynthesis
LRTDQSGPEKPPAAPKVTVIIPVYNGAAFIADTVKSVLAQTFRDFELIVLDDGSTDDTPNILGALQDPALRVVRKSNSGVADTRNQGLGLARGELVAFLDADDLFTPENLAHKVRFLDEHPDVGLVHSEIYFFNESGNLRTHGRAECQGSVLAPLLEFKAMVNSPSSALIRRELLARVGGFDIRLSTSADRDLWIRLAAETRFGYLPEPLVRYRLHSGQMHHNIDAMERDLGAIYEKLWGERKYFRNRKHYVACRIRAERILAGSYFWHTRKYHKVVKHLALALAYAASRLLP